MQTSVLVWSLVVHNEYVRNPIGLHKGMVSFGTLWAQHFVHSLSNFLCTNLEVIQDPIDSGS